MPLMTTRGALSARGFGLFGNPRKWVTVTFTADTTWTCPVGVTWVNLSGHGSAALSDYSVSEGYDVVAGQVASPVVGSSPPYADWATLYNYFTNIQDDFASLPGYVPSFTLADVYVAPNNFWIINNHLTYNTYATKWVTGFYYYTENNPQTSGIITYSQLAPAFAAWHFTVVSLEPGHAGTASTGFGDSFPGGVYSGTYPYGIAVPAITTSFSNVAVTPATGYPLVIPTGGSISISYLV